MLQAWNHNRNAHLRIGLYRNAADIVSESVEEDEEDEDADEDEDEDTDADVGGEDLNTSWFVPPFSVCDHRLNGMSSQTALLVAIGPREIQSRANQPPEGQSSADLISPGSVPPRHTLML